MPNSVIAANPTKWWTTKVQAAALQDYFVSNKETLKGKWCGKFWWNNNSFCKDRLRLSLHSTVWAQGRKSRTEGDGYTSFYHNATKPTSFSLSLTWNFSGGKKVRQRFEATSIQQYNKIKERK